jgi:membrane protease YdiL (CAAX protease family)
MQMIKFNTTEKIFSIWWLRCLLFIAGATLISLSFTIFEQVILSVVLGMKKFHNSDMMIYINLAVDFFELLSIIALSFILDIFRPGSKVFSFGLMITNKTSKDILLGLIISLLSMIIVLLVGVVFNSAVIVGSECGFSRFLTMTLFILISAISEELIFRGIVFQAIYEKFGTLTAILISCMFFALGHIFNPNLGWISMLNLVIGGVLMGFMYIQTKSLWLVISFHFSWNWFQAIFLGSPISGKSFGMSLLSINFYNLPKIIFGGAFGVEGGLLATILLIYITYFIVRNVTPSAEISAMNYKRKYFESIASTNKII